MLTYACYAMHRCSDGSAIYRVGRLNSKAAKDRTVLYEQSSQKLKCSCNQTTTKGITCRHILRVSTQLNLEQLPEHQFPTRWCKDPATDHLFEQYRKFYLAKSSQDDANQPEETYTPMQHEDFQLFTLSKTMRKLEQFAKHNPGTAKALHGEISKILDTISESYDTAQSSSLQIRNPLVVSTKGSKKKSGKSVDKSGQTKKITCRACGQQGHTSRSKKCPGKRVSDSEETVDGELINLSEVSDLEGNFHMCY